MSAPTTDAAAQTAGKSGDRACDEDATVLSIRYRARVGTGGRVRLQSPHLREGEEVEVEVGVPPAGGRTGLEIIEALGGQRLFKTAEEVDAHLAQERSSWDR